MSSFFLKSQGKNKLVQSIKVLPAIMKSMNPLQKYPLIIESFPCILNIFVFYVFVSNKFLSLFWNMFNSKNFKISNFNIFCIQSNLMCTSICIFIKIYCICSIFYSFGKVISRVSTIKSRLILIIFLYSKIC